LALSIVNAEATLDVYDHGHSGREADRTPSGPRLHTDLDHTDHDDRIGDY
jgi:hypothetical protein